jgi:multidrug efflux pump subunit AcrA (membrane-fusion protein)
VVIPLEQNLVSSYGARPNAGLASLDASFLQAAGAGPAEERRPALTVVSLLRIATVALALYGSFGLSGCKQENKLVAPAPPKLGVAQPVRQSVTPHLEATGNTVAYNQVDLVARVDGS